MYSMKQGLGYGSLIIANDNTTLCTDVDSSLGQISILKSTWPMSLPEWDTENQ